MIGQVSSHWPALADSKQNQEKATGKYRATPGQRYLKTGTIQQKSRCICDRDIRPAGNLTIFMESGHAFVKLTDDSDHSEVCLGKYPARIEPIDTISDYIDDDPLTTGGAISTTASPFAAIACSPTTVGASSAGSAGTSTLGFLYAILGWSKGQLLDESSGIKSRGIDMNEIPHISFSLSSEKIAHMKGWLEMQKQNPTDFCLLSTNCFQFAQTCLNETGYQGYITDFADNGWKSTDEAVSALRNTYLQSSRYTDFANSFVTGTDGSALPNVKLHEVEKVLRNAKKHLSQIELSEDEKQVKIQLNQLIQAFYQMKPAWRSHPKKSRYNLLRKLRKMEQCLSNGKMREAASDTTKKVSPVSGVGDTVQRARRLV